MSDEALYHELDQLHGQVLRAKYRLRETSDRDALRGLVVDIVYLARSVESEWQSFEALPD